jgi:hypothetical protein
MKHAITSAPTKDAVVRRMMTRNTVRRLAKPLKTTTRQQSPAAVVTAAAKVKLPLR